jgi:hypothetical protein
VLAVRRSANKAAHHSERRASTIKCVKLGFGVTPTCIVIRLDLDVSVIQCNHYQGFFFRWAFFTGGHRNYRLPRNLKNLAILPDEFFQTNFEFKFFCVKTTTLYIQFVQTCPIIVVVRGSKLYSAYPEVARSILHPTTSVQVQRGLPRWAKLLDVTDNSAVFKLLFGTLHSNLTEFF